MGVDLEFELKYILSDALGKEVEVKILSFDSSTGELCIEIDGKKVCSVFKQCKGLDQAKALRCVAKALSGSEKAVSELVEKVKAVLG